MTRSKDTANANVVFPRPGGGPYTYLTPEGHLQPLLPGIRVLAPFGARILTGIVVEANVRPPKGIRLKRLKAVIDDYPLVGQELLDLARWISRYYFCEFGEAVRAVVPGIFMRVGDRRIRLVDGIKPAGPKLRALQGKIIEILLAEGQLLQSRLARRLKSKSLSQPLAALAGMGLIEITDHLPLLPKTRQRTMVEALGDTPDDELKALLARSPRQRECLDFLQGMSAPVELSLLNRFNFSPAIVGALAKKGLINKYQVYDPRDPFRHVDFPDYQAPEPSPDQKEVIAALRQSLASHNVFLLHGVTGSGKTLVYMELLRPVLKAGKQAIILVPEIALTAQTTGRFRAVFGPQVAVLHSGLSDGERYDIWQQINQGKFSIAVGARSAVFAPFQNPGIIIIDEEQEHTYKEAEYIPRYHAREVAIWRMNRAAGPVVLGSATPCLESYYKASQGEYRLLELPERAQGLPLPQVNIFDLRKGWSKKKSSLVGEKLLKEIDFALQAEGQALLLLNRRGFNTFMICEECGQVVECRHCRISLTLHRRLKRLLCHYCGAQQPVPCACAACGSKRLTPMGVGTEQLESILEEKFPQRVIDRMDMDTTGGKWSHHEILERLRSGATDILVGTQMIAKGLDFPDVLLVGVVNADTAMNLPDFRATERTFDLLAQVAGRTGRGQRGGEVVIQTFRPTHPAIRAAVTHDFISFAKEELAIRREAEYPPFVNLLNVMFTGMDENVLAAFAEKTAGQLEKLFRDDFSAGRLKVVGPAPCPLEKIRGKYRYHLIVKSESSEAIERAGSFLAREAKPPGKGKCRLILDRDPSSLL